jgi:hypothetical protein
MPSHHRIKKKNSPKKRLTHTVWCLVSVCTARPAALLYFILDLWVFIFSGPHFPRLHHKNHGRDDVSDIECRAATKKIVASAPTWPASRRHFDEYPAIFSYMAYVLFYSLRSPARHSPPKPNARALSLLIPAR